MHRHARLHQLVLAHGARRVLDRVEAHGDDRHGERRPGEAEGDDVDHRDGRHGPGLR